MRDALPLLRRTTAVSLLDRLLLRADGSGRWFRAAVIVSALFAILALGQTSFADDSDLFQLSTHNIILYGVQDEIGDFQTQFGVFDFDDLHQFNVYFDSVQNDESTGSGAVDSLNVVWLGDSRQAARAERAGYKMAQPAEALRMRDWQKSGIDGGAIPTQAARDDVDHAFFTKLSIDDTQPPNSIGVAYGVGALDTNQLMRERKYGSILHDAFWMTGVDNQVLGPKAGLIWRNTRGGWSFDMQGLLLLGFNSGRIADSSAFGYGLIPGALNQPLYGRPTSFSTVESRADFAPIGELHAQTRFQLTKSIAVRSAWSGVYAGNLLFADGEINAVLPHVSFVVDTEHLFVHQFFCGLEFVR